MSDVLTIALCIGLAWLIVAAFAKPKTKSVTGWFTVIFPPKKKGKGKGK